MKSFNDNWDGIRRKTISEAELTKVGYALVVDNKIIYRGSKQQCLKKAKEHGGLKMGKVFITQTPKNIGQSWQKEEVELDEQFKTGDKVKVPHKGKMVTGKIVRFDSGGTDKARQHGGGYVVDVGEPASIVVPKEKVQKEEVELDEGLFNSSTDTDRIFTKLDEFSKNMKTASTGPRMMRGSCSCAYMQKVADSLMNASNQQKEFFRNLIGMLEDLHMDMGSPKTNNTVLMNSLQNIISELRKYQK